MSRLVMLVSALCLSAALVVPAARAQVATAANRPGREPVTVPAPFEVTWAALDKVVRADRVNQPLLVLEQTAGFRRGHWTLQIPPDDFRAASWATCHSGGEAPIGPRSAIVEVIVRGDSASATIALSVTWSGQDPDQMQRPMDCRTLGEYEKAVERAIRRNAERAARR